MIYYNDKLIKYDEVEAWTLTETMIEQGFDLMNIDISIDQRASFILNDSDGFIEEIK